MNYHIIVESKAWNHADVLEGQIHIRWEDEIDFDIIEYQVRNEKDEIIFRSENEEDIVQFFDKESEATNATNK